jgi:hypothetical protein
MAHGLGRRFWSFALALLAFGFGCGHHHHDDFFNSQPALSVTQFFIDPPQIVQAGTTLSYQVTITNTGDATSDPLTYQLYLSNQQITLSNFTGSNVIPIGPLQSVNPIDAGFDDQSSVSLTVNSTGNGQIFSGSGFVAIVVNSTASSSALISANQPVTIR